MLRYAAFLNFIIHILFLVLFEQKNYNSPYGGMQYGLHDVERSKREMGRVPSADKLLLRSGTHPRRYESGDDLVDTKGRGKAR